MLPSLRRTPARRPKLSLVVVVHRMPEQARRTLYSLSPRYQLGVEEGDYEVIVVENSSDRPLGAAAALSLGNGFSYHGRNENSRSPARAVNAGVERARAPHVAVLIDGARLITPGVVRSTLELLRVTESAIVAVPGYHLGEEIQQRAVAKGYDEEAEARLLSAIAWPADGYRLFEIACLSGSCAGGFFVPMAESTCLTMPRDVFEELGGCDERFDLPGGGFVNLDLYARACELARTRLFVLIGEGTFHQFHGGVTTGDRPAQRGQLLDAMGEQYRLIRGHTFRSPVKPPTHFGALPTAAQRFVLHSAQCALNRPSVAKCPDVGE
jgi:hypothetical protein